MKPELNKAAFSHALSSLRPGAEFPHNVFVDGWTNFRFFDATAMVLTEFVGDVQAFLRAEHSAVACVVNLDEPPEDGAPPREFFLELNSQPSDYKEVLGPTLGWANQAPRLVCASDSGSWVMYSEQTEDIGVIAFRNTRIESFAEPLSRLYALPFSEAVKQEASWAFMQSVLSAEWQRIFSEEYC